jgi:ketosteroid isomerase-like protein
MRFVLPVIQPANEEEHMPSNVEVAREYLHALESGATGDALARFFTPDVTFTEMPNRVSPNGTVSNLERALEAAKRGQQLFQRQTYTIVNVLSEGDYVALEMKWVGITAKAIQNLPRGSEMRDHAAVFLQFRDGRIAHQRHYDCFEPW